MNNPQIRIASAMNGVERTLANIRAMSDDEIDELESLVKDDAKAVSKRLNMVKLLAGKEISKNAYQALMDNMSPEFQEEVESMKKELEREEVFTNKAIPITDSQGKPDVRIVWYSEEIKMTKQATKEIVSAEEYEQIAAKLNKLDSRESHGRMKLNSLNNIKLAIKKVKAEKQDEINEAKKVKNVSLAALGKKMMEGMKVQPVNPIEAKA